MVTCRFGPSHLGFVTLRRVLSEVNMIDDPDEAEQDVLEIIDPDLVSYTYNTRGEDQLRNSGWRMHRLQ